MLLKICIEAPAIHPILFAFEEVSALPVGTRSAEHCLTVLDGRRRRGKYRMIQFTLNYRITVPVLLIFPGQNTLWYSNFFVVLLFIPMKMLLRYFYLLWYFY